MAAGVPLPRAEAGELSVFWFLLISLVVVIAAVTLAVVGSGDGPQHTASGGLTDAPPDLLDEPLPPDRPVARADVDGLRLAVAVRGYRMDQVDDVLDRLGAELAERDARIAELESALAGAQAAAIAQDARAGVRAAPPSGPRDEKGGARDERGGVRDERGGTRPGDHGRPAGASPAGSRTDASEATDLGEDPDAR